MCSPDRSYDLPFFVVIAKDMDIKDFAYRHPLTEVSVVEPRDFGKHDEYRFVIVFQEEPVGFNAGYPGLNDGTDFDHIFPISSDSGTVSSRQQYLVS
jgi:hypothetical protein